MIIALVNLREGAYSQYTPSKSVIVINQTLYYLMNYFGIVQTVWHVLVFIVLCMYEEFEDTNGVIRIL